MKRYSQSVRVNTLRLALRSPMHTHLSIDTAALVMVAEAQSPACGGRLVSVVCTAGAANLCPVPLLSRVEKKKNVLIAFDA